MASGAYGNFAFLYNINRELYTLLYNTERIARLHYRKCGKETRDVIETFIDGVIRSKKLDNHLIDNRRLIELNLVDKIRALTNVGKMRAAGYLSATQTFRDKPLLPAMERVKVKLENGDLVEMDGYDFLRRLTNACSHVEIKPTNPAITFGNVVMSLRGYHLLLQRYYSSRLPKKTEPFNEQLMPIGDYIVTAARVPADKERSRCIREYDAYEPDVDGEPTRYFLIREYDRASADTTFMLRNQQCFKEAVRNSVTAIPEGMVLLQALTPHDSEDSARYLISYGFNREPHPLTNELLHQMTMAQRMEMCGRIVNCLMNLHCSETPIYHRMLSFESIYVCRFEQAWIPYIVKFDHAKIVTKRQVGTVIANTVESRNFLRRQGRDKYLPPEWVQSDDDSDKVDWAKVDVYSLGVLIADILSGEITAKVADLDELEEMGVSELVGNILDRMMAEAPAARCTMEEVKEVFDCEIR